MVLEMRPAIDLAMRPAARLAVRPSVRPTVSYYNQIYKQKFINNADSKLQAPQYAQR